MEKNDNLKLLLDKAWRLSSLYKIKTKTSEAIPVTFNRNRAQQHFNQNKSNRNIVLKSRQLGFTTDESIDSLDDTLFTPNIDVLLIAHIKEEALKIFDNKIDFAWKNFEPGLAKLWGVDTDRANTLKFAFGDGSYSSISVATSGRSGTYHRVHVTEFAKMCKDSPLAAKEIITGTIPAVPLEGRIDIESTAEGEDGLFHDMFWEAWNRTRAKLPTEFKAHFYNWTWDDAEIGKITLEASKAFINSSDYRQFAEYQKQHDLTDQQITYYYFKWLSLLKDWASLRQEYPTTPQEAFISSGNRLFSSDKLLLMKLRDGELSGDWTYYNKYNPMHRYGMGADVAEGIGQDSSTAAIWDFTVNEVVADYASNRIAPDMFAYELKAGGSNFGMCLIAPERNNHGHTTISKLKEIYPLDKIYKEVKKDKLTDQYTEKLGWQTNLASKPQMLYDLNTALNEELINIPSRRIVQELRTFGKEEVSESKATEETKHKDLAIATAIGWQMRNYADSEVNSIIRERQLEQTRERKAQNYAR